ncbi:MAG: 50S ribosomal protein L24 [Legionellales bacterium]|nr:50S ribosomal protein L24 [Legionellales bacterium]|tara:strand:+ start:123 stop:488 length:366 start_codon:yes stop_codon:yes gene_type:complete
MRKCKLKKGDVVQVMTGRSKGRTGKIQKVICKNVSRSKDENKKKLDYWLVVEGVNMVKKHVKPDPRAQKPGGIVSKEASIHHSNVMLVNPQTGKPERIGVKTLEDGKRVRCFKKSGEVIDA